MRYYTIILLLSILAFSSGGSYSYASGTADNKREILQLRERIAVLNVTIEGLREEIEKLSGKIAETEYKLNRKIENIGEKSGEEKQALKKIEESIRNNKDGIAGLENFLGISSNKDRDNTTDTHITNTASSAGESEKREQEIYYNTAKKFYDLKNYEKAIDAFSIFIKTYPDSVYADNSYFWLGEIFYQKKMYKQAILQYQKVIENFPNGNKVPASFLKQGISFYNLGEKENAVIILKELIRKYPNSNEAEKAKRNLAVYK